MDGADHEESAEMHLSELLSTRACQSAALCDRYHCQHTQLHTEPASICLEICQTTVGLFVRAVHVQIRVNPASVSSEEM